MMSLMKNDFLQRFLGGFAVGAIALLAMQPGLSL